MNSKKSRRWMPLVYGAVLAVCLSAGCGLLSREHQRPNLVMIVIDTLRADHLSCYGYKKIRTPNIDNLARKGILFRNEASHVPITLPSFSTIMTSTLPPTNGVHYNEGFYLDDSAVTLAEILKDDGYATGAVVGAVVLDKINGISQGFDRYDDAFSTFVGYQPFIKAMEQQLSYTQKRADEVTDSALETAGSLAKDRPFFLLVHYFDPHSPYDPPPPYSLVDPSLSIDSMEYLKDMYDGEIAFTDEQIGRLLRGLGDDGLLGNTLIVLTSDHGEAFGEDPGRRGLRGPGEAYRYRPDGSGHPGCKGTWAGPFPGDEPLSVPFQEGTGFLLPRERDDLCGLQVGGLARDQERGLEVHRGPPGGVVRPRVGSARGAEPD
jgi:arylsulfatase A-like enzyme